MNLSLPSPALEWRTRRCIDTATNVDQQVGVIVETNEVCCSFRFRDIDTHVDEGTPLDFKDTVSDGTNETFVVDLIDESADDPVNRVPAAPRIKLKDVLDQTDLCLVSIGKRLEFLVDSSGILPS